MALPALAGRVDRGPLKGTQRVVFYVTDGAGAAQTGLVDGAFTKKLAKDGANSAITVTVAEISTGRYQATFTDDGEAVWTLVVSHATYFPDGYVFVIDNRGNWEVRGVATYDGAASPTTLKLHIEVLRNGVLFEDLDDATDSVAVDIYGDSATALFSLASSTADGSPTGRGWRITKNTPSLSAGRSHYARVSPTIDGVPTNPVGVFHFAYHKTA